MHHPATSTTLASKTVPNGRWGEHTVEVRQRGDEFVYGNGWSDPVVCSEADAWRYFHENVGTAA